MLNYFVVSGYMVHEPEPKIDNWGNESIYFHLSTARDSSYQGRVTYDYLAFYASGALAERIMKYVKPGQIITVTGRLSCRRGRGKSVVQTHKATRVYFDRLRDPLEDPDMLARISMGLDSLAEEPTFPEDLEEEENERKLPEK